MFDNDDVAQILNTVNNCSGSGKTKLVAIDGLAGAGKSTLATRICQTLDKVVTVRADHFYKPIGQSQQNHLKPRDKYLQYFDWQRLLDTVMLPVLGGSEARYQYHDWADDTIVGWRSVTPENLVIIDGVFTIRPELRSFYSATVFIDTPREQRLERLLSRSYDDISWIEHWTSAEDWYTSNIQPAKYADIILDGSSV